MRISERVGGAILWLLALCLVAGAAKADVLDTIREREAIWLGHRVDAPPFSYLSSSGKPTGLAVALCEQVALSIARQLGLKALDVNFVPVNASSRFSTLLGGKSQLHCGPASATLKRRETLDFSILYFVDGAAAVVRQASYTSLSQIEKGRIGVAAGTTTEAMVRNLVASSGLGASIVTFPNHKLGLQALTRGRVDAYFGDSAIMRFQISDQGLGDDVELLPETFSFEPYALVMKRGESALRLAVDRALSELYTSGKIYELIEETLGDYPLTPLNRAVYQIVAVP
ncbi:amino acid ABC transporter substrate-binding protein [Rhodobacteraceae bacterium NNCM2]|nr:amino acid ABC transporter substrate-binding protein [Coraliihabitans acroporae]